MLCETPATRATSLLVNLPRSKGRSTPRRCVSTIRIDGLLRRSDDRASPARPCAAQRRARAIHRCMSSPSTAHEPPGSAGMKVGVMTVLYHRLPLEEALDRIAALGVELRRARHGQLPRQRPRRPGPAARRPRRARSASSSALAERAIDDLRALAARQPAPPRPGDRQRPPRDLAQDAGAGAAPRGRRVVGFSGCPGDDPEARRPNWVTCPWPPDFPEILEWQWDERVLPYWREEAERARAAGVRIAFEMHPGMSVYNPETLLPAARRRRRRRVGVQLRPEPSLLAGHRRRRGGEGDRPAPGAIVHVHAKDTALDAAQRPPQRRARHEALRAGARPLVGLPHGRLRPRRGVSGAGCSACSRPSATTARCRSSTRTT